MEVIPDIGGGGGDELGQEEMGMEKGKGDGALYLPFNKWMAGWLDG